MKFRKAQADTANAATLVAIVAALIVVYLLFLPPDVRQEILEGNASANESDYAFKEYNNTLLDERPGHLSYIAVNEYTHDLPAFNLYIITDSQTIKSQNPFVVRNAWFDKSFKRVTFSVDALSNTNNVLLSFSSPVRKGRLIIKLNDAVIYEDKMPDENSPPLSLSKELLRQNNYLDFEVSGVGIAFWATNEYSIQGLKILADITDKSRQESMSKFIVSSSEKYNLEKASLKFNPDCGSDSGILEIQINSVPVYSAVPDCNTLNTIAVPSGLVEFGENTVKFKTSKGSYIVDNVKVVTKLKEASGLVYYFDITPQQNYELQNTSKNAVLELRLVKSDEIKEADIIVNGHTTRMRASSDFYSKALQEYWLLEGSNYIKLDAKTEMDIARMKIEIK